MNKKISALVTSLAIITSTASFMPAAPSVHADEALPSSIDLSTDEETKDFLPRVFDQGGVGSCNACATTYYQFTYEARKKKYENYMAAHKNDPNQEKVREDALNAADISFSPASTYPVINSGVDEGSNVKSAYKALKERGALTLDQANYDRMEGIYFYEGKPLYTYYITDEEYSNLKNYEKSFFEPVNGGYYRRSGEYISRNDYYNLSDEDKKFYLPVATDKSLYYHFVRTYIAVPRDENALFEALKLRLDSYEGCSLSRYGITEENITHYWRTKTEKENEDLFINKVKEYLNEKKVLAASATFNYNQGMRCVVEEDENGNLIYTTELAVAQNCSELEKEKKRGAQKHEFTIVGYDDNIKCDINGNGRIDEGETGAFKIVNSWGDTDFGNKGFVWVMYDAVHKVSEVDCPAPAKGYRRVPAIEEAYKIYLSEKDIKLVSEAEIVTNNFYDICVGNSNGVDSLITNAIMTAKESVIYSGPLFADITSLCKDENGYTCNNKEYKITVNNRNIKSNTRLVVKSICLKDDKGEIVARKNIVPDEDVAFAFRNNSLYENAEETFSLNFPKGDMNYDGEFNSNDYAVVEAYFADPDNSDLSSFKLELLDANDDGERNDADLAILRADMK